MVKAIQFPPIRVPGPILLLGAVILAITAQFFIHDGLIWLGVSTYLASVSGLLVWGYQNPKWRNVFANQLQLNQKGVFLLLGLVILLTICTHFLDLNSRVYGLEADETKWTVQSWYSAILRVDIGEFASMHYQHLPVDFWLWSLFLRTFGLNFISARIESAFLGLIAVIFLFFLVRTLINSLPVALLSSLLYGLSFIELNASHQALHDTHPAAWTIGSLCFLALGIKHRKLWQFQIAGVLLAFGLLTYETFYPTPMIAVLYLLILAFIEVRGRKTSSKDWFKILLVVAWPVIIVFLDLTWPYLLEQAYHFNPFTEALESGAGYFAAIIFDSITTIFMATFSYIKWTDSLINWTGPLINPLLLPFIVIGFAYNIWNFRRPHYAFIMLWYFGEIIPAPVMLGAAWPRIMYFAVPPLMVWGALGLWTALSALRVILDSQRFRIAIPVFGLLLAAILVNDYIIFATRLTDLPERQKRRELADLTMASAKESSFILFPFMPNRDDSVLVESHVLIYSVAGARGLGLDAADHYKLVELNLLLPELWLNRNRDGLDVVFDKTSPEEREERQHALDVVLTCYPLVELKYSGRFFDIYRFSSKALQSPKCYSAPAPDALAPKDILAESPTGPVSFQWDTANYQIKSFAFTLERKRDNIFWLEAEDSFKGTGWIPVSDFVNEFTGSGFLLDEWKSGEALYSFEAPQAGQYRVWMRSYKRVINDQHNFIGINGQPAEFALNEDPLNQWVWRSVGVYDLPAAAIPLSLTRTYGVDEQYSVFVDTVVITPDLEFTPDLEDGIWDRIVSSGEINSSADQYVLPRPLASGDYRWKVRVYDGVSLIDGSGARGVASPYSNFTIP